MFSTIATTLTMVALAQPPKLELPESKDSKALLQLEDAWNEAHVKSDSEALAKLWAEDLIVTVPSMTPMTKAQSLAIWKSGKFKFERYQSSDVKTKVFGDAAVVTGRLKRTRTFGDRKLEDDWLFTKVYVRSKEGWQVVAFHASEAPKAKK